jgi:hypothetical protein
MRLLQYNDGDLSLTTFFADKIPQKYAILSHTWAAEEVTFEDLQKRTYRKKAGYKKIRFCGEQARHDGLQYFWVDTCCIDKSSSAELTEAINSMFRWYENAAKCYVFLSDVSMTKRKARNRSSEYVWEAAFRASMWFKRGWTLQELLAPGSVEFFSRECKRLGDKKTLEREIHEITKIAISALRGASLSEFEVDERFSWAENRQTTRNEDKVYSLLGIFTVYMPLIYGEGRDNAFVRLREEIAKGLTRSACNPLTSGKVMLTSQPPVKSIRSRIETSYAEYCHDLPLQFGLPREKPFCPYRLTCWVREPSILTDNTVERLEKEAAQLSLNGFFLKPDNIRFDALWNGEKHLDYKSLSATTIKDILLLMDKDMSRRSESSSTRRVLFNCILQIYRSSVDDYEVHYNGD